MHWISSFDDRPSECREAYANARLGAHLVCETMAERYGVKLKSNELAEVWALARDPSVPLHDRVVIASTFVYVWLDRANFGRFSECVAAAKLPPDCLYRRMADDLIEAADCGAVSGVCWHHASDTPDVWRAGGRLRSPAEVNASEVFDVATSAAAPPPGEPEPEPRGPQPHGVPGGTSDPANYRIPDALPNDHGAPCGRPSLADQGRERRPSASAELRTVRPRIGVTHPLWCVGDRRLDSHHLHR
jgi:hypothetical protein